MELARKGDDDRAIAYFRHAAERQPAYLPARGAKDEGGRAKGEVKAINAEVCRRIMTSRAREPEEAK